MRRPFIKLTEPSRGPRPTISRGRGVRPPISSVPLEGSLKKSNAPLSLRPLQLRFIRARPRLWHPGDELWFKNPRCYQGGRWAGNRSETDHRDGRYGGDRPEKRPQPASTASRVCPASRLVASTAAFLWASPAPQRAFHFREGSGFCAVARTGG